jgi:hypothetical protein
MWHWNSLWARAPGDPPTLGDPALWQGPWTHEQAATVQARSWEAMLTAGQSWWSYLFTMWPVPTWPVPGQLAPPTEAKTEQPATPVARNVARSPSRKSVAVAHDVPVPARKRVAKPAARHAQEARKR